VHDLHADVRFGVLAVQLTKCVKWPLLHCIATTGLIIAEATQVNKLGQGYPLTPGIYTQEHIEGWRKVTDSVHAAAGRIFLQLWHCGRVSHSSYHGGKLPISASAVKITVGQVATMVRDEHSTAALLHCYY
jgi:2,4-dienoyl-CoA reductase-like NADH-dependent reductase (Old Yellow Enzyme family)